jgi:hypothetical protein
MKYLKFLLLNALVFGGLFSLISLLLPSSVGVSKSVSINSNKKSIAQQIAALNTWNVYSSNNNTLLIQTDSLLKINHPSAGYGNLSSIFILEGENIVNVSWALQQKLRWYMPWEKFAAMVKEKSWIAGMDTSLNKLKALCEK